MSGVTPKAFYQAFPNQSLIGLEEDQYYVNRFEDVDNDVVAQMELQIAWDEGSACYLFTGLRGAGKTTELNRLKNNLEGEGLPVFYIDASQYLDLNNPELEQSILVFVLLAGLGDAVRLAYGQEVLQESVWSRFKSLMNTEIELKTKFTLPGTDTGVEFTFNENETFKQQLSAFAEGSGDFFIKAQEFVAEVRELVRQKTGQEQMVLILDSLERLSAPQGMEETLFNSLQDVFYNNPSQLYFKHCSVIYTVPPYLHAVLPNVDSHYSQTFSLSNFKVMFSPASKKSLEVNAEGINRLKETVTKRFPAWQDFLSEEVLAHFAWLSGGNVRRLFSLLRHFIRKAGLLKPSFPVTDVKSDTVKKAISEEVMPLYWLNGRDRQWLAHCVAHKGKLAQKLENLEKDLPSIIRLFDHSLILNYRNGEPWYHVLPLVLEHIDLSDNANGNTSNGDDSD